MKSGQRIKNPIISLLIALGFFIMSIAWGFSSPPGSMPDDDFHSPSIFCVGAPNEYCEILTPGAEGNSPVAAVSEEIVDTCFLTQFPSKDASCLRGEGKDFIQTSRVNLDHVSGFFYSAMNQFVGSDYDASVRMMRVVNGFLFSSLLFLALVTVLPRVRRGIVLMLMTAMVPFAAFFIPSINPSSWTITGVVFSWVFLYSLVNSIGSRLRTWRLLGLSFGLITSAVMVLGSRKDGALYLIVVAASVVILTWPKFNRAVKWSLVGLASLIAPLALMIQGTELNGFSQIVSRNFFSPGKLIETTVELPSVIAGIIGSGVPIFRSNSFFYYGIGWHEVQMPTLVILITLPTLAGLVFALIPGASRRLIAAVGLMIAAMIVSQIYVVAMVDFSGYANATPRYMTPLFLVAVVTFFSVVRVPRKFPSRGQAIWIFFAMPLASGIALLTTIRRYTNGQRETWFKLFFEPNWWWEGFFLSPTALWLVGVAGSLLIAWGAILTLRDSTSTDERNIQFGRDFDVMGSEKGQTVQKATGSEIRWRTTIFSLSLLFSLLSAWFLLRLPGESNPAANLFRGYFPDDQLSYAGIAASAKAGNFGLVEPFTQTGVSFYPSWWYKIIGQFSSWTGMDIPAAWSFLGLVIVLGSVAFIGFAAYRISGRAWAPLVLGLLLWIGPLSSILFDNWFVRLDSHAVMWGPYGALYPLNGEAAGLSIGSVALVLGYWTLAPSDWSRNKRIALFGLAGLGLGVIANFQTYSFLTLTAVALWSLSVAGLIRARSRQAAIFTSVLLIVALVVGVFLRDVIGALPVYALMLAPSLLGIWHFAKGRIAMIATGLFLFAVGAAPQILWMVSGTLSADPFLTYRVDQSGELGVPLWAFILIGSPVLLTWVAILWAQVLRRGFKEIALLVGWFIPFVLLTFNNAWGFGQEPYRFWIDSVIVFVVIAGITVPTALGSQAKSRASSLVLAGIAVVLVGASIWNVGGFRAFVAGEGNINFDSPRLQAIEELVATRTTSGDLLTAEPCIDPRQLKTATGSRVAFYNLGLAWPENKVEIDAVIEANNAGALNVDLMRAAGINYLITDSSCPTIWYPGNIMGVAQAGSVEYDADSGRQRVDLWKIL